MRGRRNIIQPYTSLLQRWFDILSGRSYYHVSQPLGRFIDTRSIGGYYNDLTKKAEWKGISNSDGVPINILSNGVKVYFPITIAQMALGNYDLWLENNDSENKRRFLTLANWLKENQDDAGGWENPWKYLRPSSISNYSAMAQGEVISVLVRASLMTKDDSFAVSAKKAFDLMVTPVECNGCAYYINENIYLEEYPENPRSTVLNGEIFALFGMYDLMLLTKSERVRKVLNNSLQSLEENLDSYDTGYWSYYDLSGIIGSPFYHSLHISILNALYLLTGRKSFDMFSKKWAQYEKRFLNKNRALFAKAIQKLKYPPKVSIKK